MAETPPRPVLSYRSYALSDVGSVRGNNEDEVYANDEQGVYFVVDGMGGHAAGEEAARIGKERLRARLERLSGSPEQRMREAIALANNAIFDAAREHPEWSGMACVLTAAVFDGQEVTIGHVGDSRLYKIRPWTMEKITRDHSPVGELEDADQISEAIAMAHPRRNEVYRDAGSMRHDTHDPDFIDIYTTTFEPASALLLCTDGLTDAIPKQEILDIVRVHAADAESASRKLIDRAVEHGKDNVSVVLVTGSAFGSSSVQDTAALTLPAAPQGAETCRAAPAIPNPSPQLVLEPAAIFQDRPWWRFSWGRLIWMLAGALLALAVPWGLSREGVWSGSQSQWRQGRGALNRRTRHAFPSIAAALAAARPGDTIELAPGDHTEALTLKSDVSVEGEGAAVSTVTVTSGARVRIADLKFVHGAVAVRIQEGDAIVHNIDVAGANEVGIEVTGKSILRLDGSRIHETKGPGILIRDSASADLRFNQISNNAGPGLRIETHGDMTLLGNSFERNAEGAIVQYSAPTTKLLLENLFDGRIGQASDIHVIAYNGRH